MKNFRQPKNGYIAITLAIILSFFMLLIAIILGSASLFARNNNLNFYFKKTSYFVSWSCLDYALLQLSQNSNYAGNETRNVDVYQCAIQPIEISGANKIIKSRAQVSGATTDLKLTVASADLSTVSLEEVTGF